MIDRVDWLGGGSELRVNLNKHNSEDKSLEAISFSEARYGTAVILGTKPTLTKIQPHNPIEVKKDSEILSAHTVSCLLCLYKIIFLKKSLD